MDVDVDIDIDIDIDVEMGVGVEMNAGAKAEVEAEAGERPSYRSRSRYGYNKLVNTGTCNTMSFDQCLQLLRLNERIINLQFINWNIKAGLRCSFFAWHNRYMFPSI